jgi:hypothetical protein
MLPEQVMYKPIFDLVAPKDNWKGPIDATIEAPREAGDREIFCKLMVAAVQFYTGSMAVVEWTGVKSKTGWPQMRVTAAGYYAAIGA